MGFRFRRSIRLLPGLRLNLSGSGASVSVGPRGLKYTVGKNGTRITTGISGTGISWSEYTPHAKPSVETRVEAGSRIKPLLREPFPVPGETTLAPIENATAEEINALSTSELVPLLNSANRTIRISVFIQVISILLFGAALVQGNDIWIFISASYAALFIPAAIFLDRYRRSVKVVYEPGGALGQIAEALNDSFQI
jgi:hypothetical protein